MKVVQLPLLDALASRHPDARAPLATWLAEARAATWRTPHDVLQRYPKASILKGSRCVFNILGNRYRLVVKINYGAGVVQVRWCGTHEDYDRIDAEVI